MDIHYDLLTSLKCKKNHPRTFSLNMNWNFLLELKINSTIHVEALKRREKKTGAHAWEKHREADRKLDRERKTDREKERRRQSTE